MTARELHDRLGRLLDERVVDADAEVFVVQNGAYRIAVIDPVNVDAKLLKDVFGGDVSLCFGRLK